jgi:hypothetical protein
LVLFDRPYWQKLNLIILTIRGKQFEQLLVLVRN